MTANHLKLNIDKTELLFMLGKDCPQMDLLVTIEDIKVSPSPSARNLGVVLDEQLCHLCGTILKNSEQLLPGWTPRLRNQTLTTHPECSSVPGVQLIQMLPFTPLFCNLHWLPIARIRFKTLVLVFVLAYKAVSGTAPTYLQTLVRPHTPARALRSTTSAAQLVPPSRRKGKHHTAKSQLFWHSHAKCMSITSDMP